MHAHQLSGDADHVDRPGWILAVSCSSSLGFATARICHTSAGLLDALAIALAVGLPLVAGLPIARRLPLAAWLGLLCLGLLSLRLLGARTGRGPVIVRLPVGGGLLDRLLGRRCSTAFSCRPGHGFRRSPGVALGRRLHLDPSRPTL